MSNFECPFKPNTGRVVLENQLNKTRYMDQNNTAPVLAFTRILKEEGAVETKRLSKLIAIYLKFLPSGIMGKLEDVWYRKKVEQFEHPYPPLYLLGHWRSGTTFLHMMLGQDPDLTFHSKFASFFPDSFLLTQKTTKPLANRFLNTFGAINAWRDGISMDMSMDSPSEIEVGMINQARRETFHWGHVFPKSWQNYFDRYLFQRGMTQEEMAEWQASVRYLNRKVNFNAPEKRLMVKNPGDTARVKSILDIYPNAKFVFLHRDPYDVFYSNKKLWRNLLGHVSLQSMNEDELDEAILYIYEHMHRAYFEQRELIPEGNLVEISHRELSEQPVETLEYLYDAINLPGFSKVRPHFEREAQKRGQSKPSRGYDYRSIDVKRINKRWSFAFREWGYAKRPVKRKEFVTSH